MPVIFHIDDDQDFLTLFSITFHRWFKIISFDNPEDFFETLKGKQCDAIITDYDMPEINGLLLLEKIKSFSHDIPVIFYTGQGNEEIAREAFLSGASDYFTKDIFSFAHKEKMINSVKKAVLARKNEIEKRETENKYRHLAENISDVVWTADLNFRLNYVSPSIYKMTGELAETYIGKTLEEKHPPSSIEHLMQIFGEEIQRETDPFADRNRSRIVEIEMYKKDGSIIWISMNMSFIRDEEGKAIGIQGSTRDITEQKKAETALRAQRDYSADIIWASPAVICGITPEGICTFLNPAGEEVTGYKAEELVGMNWWTTLYPGSEYGQVERLFEDFKEGSVRDYEMTLTRKDGSRRTVAWNSIHSVDRDGNFIELKGFGHDITQWKKAEEEMKLQTRLQELMSDISSIYISLPMDQVDEVVEVSLGTISEFVGADRAYVFYYDFAQQTCSNVYEWCREGIEPQIEKLKNIPLTIMPDWIEAHQQGKNMHIPDVYALPPDNPIRKILEPQEIKSLITVPMMDDKLCLGFIGFDSVGIHHHYSEAEIRLLKLFAQMLVNINKRREAEETLRKNRDILNATQQISGIGGWEWDMEKQNMIWTDEVYRIHGLEPGDIKEGALNHIESSLNCYMPEDRPVILKAFRRCIEEGEPYSLEFPLTTKQGKQIWILTEARPVIQDGKIIRVAGNIMDITQQNMIKQELIAAEEKYRVTFETTGTATLIVNRDTTIAMVNKEFCRLTGMEKVEIENILSWKDFVPEEDLGRMLEYHNLRRIDPDSAPDSYETHIINKYGEIRDILLKVAMIPGTDQSIISLMDISDRKMAESEASKNEKRLRILLESSGQPIVSINREGIIQYINSVASDFFNQTTDFLTGKNLWEFIPPTTGENYKKTVVQAIDNNSFKRKEIEISVNSKKLWLDIGIHPALNDKGSVDSALIVATDITERKNMEKELLNINQELNDFAFRVSHDLKNPLRLINGYLQVIRENPEFFDEYFDRTTSQTKKMISFIDNLLKLSRAGITIDKKVPIDLEEMINELFTGYSAQDRNSRLTLSAENRYIYGDPESLKHVFSNMIENSFRYRDQEKEILTVDIKSTAENNYQVITLKDNGIGIEEKHIINIFNPGFTLSRNKGTGFGLAIVKKIVDAHGGSIDAVSQGTNEGIEFIIRIPAKPDA